MHAEIEAEYKASPTKAELRARFLCVDCSTDTSVRGISEYYVVHHEIWAEGGLERQGGMLCVACLEARIGRVLIPDDFSSAPLNLDPEQPRSERLSKRMGLA